METSLPITAARGLPGRATGKELPLAGNLPPTVRAGSDEVRSVLPVEKASPAAITSIEAMEKVVKQINDLLRDRQRELEFSVDEGSGRTVVKVIHSETGEVIRQLPPDVVLQFANAFTEGSANLMEAFA